MKLKTLAIVSGVLVLLAAVALAVNRWGGSSTADRTGEPVMKDVRLDQVSRVELESAKSTITLTSPDGTNWNVVEQGNFPVDTKKLKDLFVKLQTVKIAHEVTRTKERLGELALLTKEENGGKLEAGKTGRMLRVLDKSGKPVFSLLIGKDRQAQGGMAFGGTYVRYPDQSAAYLVSEDLVRDLQPQDWIDTQVLRLEADKVVRSVRVERPGQRTVQISHEKAGDPWAVTGISSEQLDQDATRSVVNQLAGLDVFKVAAKDATPQSLGRAKVGRVTMELFDKRAFTLDIGEAKAPDDFRYLSMRAELDPSVQDADLKKMVQDFNARFEGRVLGIYDWDGARILQDFDAYKRKPKQ